VKSRLRPKSEINLNSADASGASPSWEDSLALFFTAVGTDMLVTCGKTEDHSFGLRVRRNVVRRQVEGSEPPSRIKKLFKHFVNWFGTRDGVDGAANSRKNLVIDYVWTAS
jgi:hypothetical protein